MEAAIDQRTTRNLNLAVPVAVVAVVLVMILPVPPGLLDMLISTNIPLSVITLIVTMYITKPVQTGSENDPNKPRVVALVGPTGVGKTTTLAKIAVQFGIQQGRAVHLVSTDSYRVGAIDQLQLYAGILGVEWTAVDGANDLASALGSFEKKGSRSPDLVLIDTPGYGFSELERSRELAHFLSSRAEIDIHLVLSACTKTRDLRLAIEKYRALGPRKLLFTKLDETLSFGPLLNETLRTRWPISLLGTGQSIPEDLIPATRNMLAHLVVKRELPLAEGERKRA